MAAKGKVERKNSLSIIFLLLLISETSSMSVKLSFNNANKLMIFISSQTVSRLRTANVRSLTKS